MEPGRSSDEQFPVMRLFQKFVTSAGILLECTHRGCKPVFEEKDSNSQLPDHDWSSLENIMSDILPGEVEAVELVGMYACFLWETEGHDP
jgi:hypothetical protein